MGLLSIVRWRSPRTACVTLTWALVALEMCVLLVACERHADIRDEPDASLIVKPMPEIDAGDIPELDSGLVTDAYPLCGDRSVSNCRGPVDFPCAFQAWVNSTAADCQEATSCKTNGFLEVKLGADGCVVEIGMDQPNDDIVACIVSEFGSQRCLCGEDTAMYFFGYTNMGACYGPPH
jgi:hypothetical protein